MEQKKLILEVAVIHGIQITTTPTSRIRAFRFSGVEAITIVAHMREYSVRTTTMALASAPVRSVWFCAPSALNLSLLLDPLYSQVFAI